MAKKNKNLTLADFVAKAKQKEQDKFKAKAVFVPSLDGEIMLQKIPVNIILDALDKIESDESTRNVVDIYKELIYDSAPVLKEKELQDQFTLIEPFDIVTDMFELGEILQLGNEILSLYGLDKLDETIKN